MTLLPFRDVHHPELYRSISFSRSEMMERLEDSRRQFAVLATEPKPVL